MNITREMIEAQKREYVQKRQELWNNVNALSGAIDDCDIWLSILDKKEAVDGSPGMDS